MIYFLIVLSGLAVGSFLNCVIYRLQAGESFLKGFSCCPLCRHKLNWRDLIPLLSFAFLKGRCRYCQQKISFQYPLVELTTAALFSLIYFNFLEKDGFPGVSLLFLISCFLVVIFVYDLKHYIIPDKAVYPAIAAAFFYRLFFPLFSFSDFPILNPLLSALGAAGLFFLIWFISKGKWLGFGDVKLVLLMGFLLGFPNILAALFSAFFIGAIIGIGLIVCGKKQLSSQVPFGPFLVTGTFLSLFLGQDLIDWYFHLFL